MNETKMEVGNMLILPILRSSQLHYCYENIIVHVIQWLLTFVFELI